MAEQCTVICTNDYPDCVVIGTEIDIEHEVARVERECKVRYPDSRVYVHTKTVPLIKKCP